MSSLAARFGFSAVLLVAGVVGLRVQAEAQGDLDTSTLEHECSAEFFTSELELSLSVELDGLAYTAAAFDTRTNCWYSLKPEVSLTTASAIKLQVLAANLDRAESLGRELTTTERQSAARMLWFSHNSPVATQLYSLVGTAGMTAFSRAVGATAIEHSSIYGITWTPAADLTRASLATLNLDVESPLSVESREYARQLVSRVHDSQTWGISAGLPDDHQVWLKNGFYPCRSCRPFVGEYTWRVSSTGYVERPDGSGWAISVLTDGAASQAEGVEAVETIAAAIAGHLGSAETATPGVRAVDQANCTTVDARSTAASVTAALGVSASTWDDVRWVSGNEGPLVGQLMCSREPLDVTSLSACICPGRPVNE